jgi:AcrR family transcriptional regulator
MTIQVRETGSVTEARGPAARTRKLMLETTMRLMQSGITPSVTDVAEAAGLSRATAYRYFPSQAALVHAAVGEGLGPILQWQSDSTDAEERIVDLLDTSMPRIREYEATFKASLKLSLEQWARSQSDTLGEEPLFKRGHRVAMLQYALAPLKGKLPRKEFLRLAKALSLVYGLEVLLVLKDIWGAGEKETRQIAEWTARALVNAAMAEAGLLKKKSGGGRRQSVSTT